MNGRRRCRKLAVLLVLALGVVAAPARAVPLPGGPAEAAATLFVEYATTDESGAPAAASGLVYLPHGAAPAGGWPVVS